MRGRAVVIAAITLTCVTVMSGAVLAQPGQTRQRGRTRDAARSAAVQVGAPATQQQGTQAPGNGGPAGMGPGGPGPMGGPGGGPMGAMEPMQGMRGPGGPGSMGGPDGGPMGAMEPMQGMRGPGGPGPMGGPPMGPGGPGELERLGLTDAQQQRIEDLRDEEQRKVIRLEADLRIAELDLARLTAAERPSLTAIGSQVDRIADLRAGMMKARMASEIGVRGVLTAEQLAKLKKPGPGPQGAGMRPGAPRQAGGPPPPPVGAGMQRGDMPSREPSAPEEGPAQEEPADR